MKRSLILLLAMSFALGSTADTDIKQTNGMQRVTVADFSSLQPGNELPEKWEPVTIARIPQHTQYMLATVDGATVLRAEANASMSSLAVEASIDTNETPWLQWRWRIAELNSKSDLRTKEGDDFPVRIYVFFDYDIMQLPFFERVVIRVARTLYGEQLPLAALCYVWAPDDPPDTTAWNAYTNRVHMVVATSGGEQVDQWVTVERNVRNDYLMAFGSPVPRITGIALATDTDNTGGRSLAWYGDIVFADQRQQQP